MPKSPLDHPRLREIEQRLDEGALDDAQQLLASLGDVAFFRYATAYLATRLLFLRGRLDDHDVAERLSEILGHVDQFPEAQAMLRATGLKVSSAESALSTGGTSDPPPTSSAAGNASQAADDAEPAETPAETDPPPSDVPAPPLGPLSVKPIHAVGNTPTSDSPSKDAEPAVPEPNAASAPSPHTASPAVDSAWPELGRPSAPTGTPSPLGMAVVTATEPVPTDVRAASIPELEVPQPAAQREVPSIPELDLRRHAWTPPSTPAARKSSTPPRSGFTEPINEAAGQPPDAFDIPKAPAVPDLGGNSPIPTNALKPPSGLTRRQEMTRHVNSRYSETPRDAEVLRNSQRPPQRAFVAPAQRRGGFTTDVASMREPSDPGIRSGPPSATDSTATGERSASTFELTRMLDSGKFKAVVEATEDAEGAELSLIRARAQAGAGDTPGCMSTLRRLEAAPLLDPELRAGVARLLLECGEFARAFDQARSAYDDDPRSPMARIVFAWTAVRLNRRNDDESLLEAARHALALVMDGPMPGVTTALSAVVQALGPEPARATSTVEKALAIAPGNADALAARALVAARLGQKTDAQHAWFQLLDRDFREADAVSSKLVSLGVDLDDAAPRTSTHTALKAQAGTWDKSERALISNFPKPGVSAIEAEATREFEELGVEAHDIGAVASLGGAFMTSAAAFRDFSPYDFSLFSLRRLDAGLDALYGEGPRDAADDADTAITTILACYLGETICSAFAGEWESIASVRNARVRIAGKTVSPFRLIKSRIRQGSEYQISAALALEGIGRTATAWRVNRPATWSTTNPWQGEWPTADDMQRLGKSVQSSVVSAFCEKRAHGPLDGSISSLASVDAYLELIGPQRVALDIDAPWARRIAVLVGAYVGEVLRRCGGSPWFESGQGARRIRITMPGNVDACPIEAILGRLGKGNPPSIVDYVRSLTP